MSTIPKEIKKQIDAEFTGDTLSAKMAKSAAEFGYQLATDGREELEKEWVCECKKEKGFTMVAGYSYCNSCGKRY